MSLTQRYISVLCGLMVFLTAFFICERIISFGLIPAGDARRHVAKPFANKPYSEMVVMRSEYVVDHSPGWEWLLGALHRTLGWDESALMNFSITSLILWIFCLPLIWMRRPEAWLAAILALMITDPGLLTRWDQARPFVLTQGVLMALLLCWSKEENKSPSWQQLAWSSAGFFLAVWMHGVWYLWILLLLAFFLAGRGRSALWLTLCWIIGTVTAGILTGKPVSFLYEAIFQACTMYREHLPWWMLVGELQPDDGKFSELILLVLVFLWFKLQKKVTPPLLGQPVVWMMAINWVLGFTAARFWADWGRPAALVWLATRFEEGMVPLVPGNSLKRLGLCSLVALPLFLDVTNDSGGSYSFSRSETFLRADDPKLKGWFPEKNGLFYADNMTFFFNTFYANPTAEWRYVVGFEPALMLPEDLKVYRAIQRSYGAPEAYEPWVKKMQPEDRLASDGQRPPALPLEWKQAGDFWLGRLPGKGTEK